MYTHKEILKRLKEIFPEIVSETMVGWFPNGKNSIRYRNIHDEDFIFTYHSSENWKLETVKSFLNGLYGGK